MKRFTTHWTAAIAASALLMLPATSAAQSAPQPPPTAPPAQTQTGTTDTTAAQAAAQGQADSQEARRLLTEARNTLSELTQLPQASQLSGEARTQVSQLIANFNELITAQENWRASFTKVESNLDALLGPERPAPATTGTVTGTTGTTITGTAGTTGGAIVDVAPEIRDKLVEFRAKLNEFETAAGGTATGAMPPATPPAEPQTDPAAAPAQIDQAELLRHIEAIEAILNANDPASTTGTSGVPPATPPTTPPAGAASTQPVTLSPAQLAQLRMHLGELRAIIGR